MSNYAVCEDKNVPGPSDSLVRKVLPKLMLLAVFVIAFLIRAYAFNLPALSAQDRPYFQDEAGNPYFSELDSYFYLRKTEEMAVSGQAGWTVNRNEDPMIASETADPAKGVSVPLGISVLAYMVWKLLLSGLGTSMTQVAVWMGPILGSLAWIPAFLYVKKRTSLAGGITAALLTGCAIPFVVHTHAGFFDTDMVLTALPLTAVLSQMRCLQEPDARKQAGWSLLSAVAFVLMALCWRGFPGYWWLAFGSSVICLILSLFLPSSFRGGNPRELRKQWLRGTLYFVAFSLLLMLAAGGTKTLGSIWTALGDFLARQAGVDAMPYALAFTQEMKPQNFLPETSILRWVKADTGSTMGRLGGAFSCLLALISIPCAFFLKTRKKREDPEGVPHGEGTALVVEAVFLGIWTIAGIWLACSARRFAEVAVLPVCLLGGLTVGRLFSLVGEWKERRKTIAVIMCAGLLFCTVAPVCYGAWRSIQKVWPMLSDSKHDALAWVQENTPEDTVIASWWDDGYYMQYQGKRRTLADGGSDSGALNWLLARALLTDDVNEMTGILRMLNTSGTTALKELTNSGMDQAQAAKLLNRILPLSEAKARSVLREAGISESLLNKTHPRSSPPLLLMLSSDMMAKCRVYGYYAYWDPETREQKEKAFAMGSSASAAMEEDRLTLEMTNSDYSVSLQQDPQGRITGEYTDHGTVTEPGRICVWENGVKVQDDRLDNGNMALVAVKENGRYCAVLCSENLCDSMLMRLLVCGDESLPQVRLRGTWYGRQEAEPCDAQNRIAYNDIPAWTVQVWQVSEKEDNIVEIPDACRREDRNSR